MRGHLGRSMERIGKIPSRLLWSDPVGWTTDPWWWTTDLSITILIVMQCYCMWQTHFIIFARDIWLASLILFAFNDKIPNYTFSRERKKLIVPRTCFVMLFCFYLKKGSPLGDIGFQQRIRSRLSVNAIKGEASSIPPIEKASNRFNFSILRPLFVLPEGSQGEKSLQIRHDLLDVKV